MLLSHAVEALFPHSLEAPLLAQMKIPCCSIYGPAEILELTPILGTAQAVFETIPFETLSAPRRAIYLDEVFCRQVLVLRRFESILRLTDQYRATPKPRSLFQPSQT